MPIGGKPGDLTLPSPEGEGEAEAEARKFSNFKVRRSTREHFHSVINIKQMFWFVNPVLKNWEKRRPLARGVESLYSYFRVRFVGIGFVTLHCRD